MQFNYSTHQRNSSRGEIRRNWDKRGRLCRCCWVPTVSQPLGRVPSRTWSELVYTERTMKTEKLFVIVIILQYRGFFTARFIQVDFFRKQNLNKN